MMKLVLNRFRTVRGAVVGRLSQEIVDRKGGVVDHEHICDTVEREGGCLEPGEYRVVVAKCRSFARKMMFLEAVKKEASSSSDASSGVAVHLFLSPKSASAAAWSASIIGSGAWMSFMPFRAPCSNRAMVRSVSARVASSSARLMLPASSSEARNSSSSSSTALTRC